MTPHAQIHTARESATQVVRILRDAGHVAYFAGGCVRDKLLGLTPEDYDIATDARPERVRELFRNSKFVGEAFGVVLVRLLGHEVEVATFRVESGYADGRRPTQVEFTDAQNDARRRDFTVNGLFEDPLAASPEEAIIDFVGGRADLKSKQLRAIGDADARFADDYLRMLRAVRFASRFGFSIDEKTARAIRLHARYLGQISRERIGMEVMAMLCAPTRGAAASLIQDLRLDGPTLNEEHLDRPVAVLSNLPNDASYPTAIAAWMIDRHAPTPAVDVKPPVIHQTTDEAAVAPEVRAFLDKDAHIVLRRWRKALCLSNDDRDSVQSILTLLHKPIQWGGMRVAHRKRALASPAWVETFSLFCAMTDRVGVAERTGQIASEAALLIEDGVAPPPWITGDDLIAIGLKPGPAFKQLLDDVYDAQLENSLASRHEAMGWIKERI